LASRRVGDIAAALRHPVEAAQYGRHYVVEENIYDDGNLIL
jgi:hypothetical protein